MNATKILTILDTLTLTTIGCREHTKRKSAAVLLLGFLLTFASCQRVDVPGNSDLPAEDSEPIEFSGITGWLETKADAGDGDAGEDDESTPIPFDKFNVWAQDGTNYNVFGQSGTEVSTSDEGSTWTYSPVRYWQAGTYDFYAVTPTDKATGSLSADGLSLSFGTDGWNLSVDQTDLLLATTPEVTGRFNTDDTPAPVELTFNHLLSKISFSARNADPDEKVAITVTGIKVYGNSKIAKSMTCQYVDGTFDVTLGNGVASTDSDVFKDYEESSVVLTRDYTEEQDKKIYSYTDICPGFLVFPESCDLTILVTFTQTYDNYADGAASATKKATITGATWKPGFVYDYKLTVTADAIAMGEPTVKRWTDGGIADDDVIEF